MSDVKKGPARVTIGERTAYVHADQGNGFMVLFLPDPWSRSDQHHEYAIRLDQAERLGKALIVAAKATGNA